MAFIALMTSALDAPSKLTKSRSVRGTQVKAGRSFMSGGHASRQAACAVPANRRADVMAMVACKAGFPFDRLSGQDDVWLPFPSVLRFESGRLASVPEWVACHSASQGPPAVETTQSLSCHQTAMQLLHWSVGQMKQCPAWIPLTTDER